MPYEVHGPVDDLSPGGAEASSADGPAWPMWEVFVRARRGMSHVHAGSLHAADAETALQHARDVYTRRMEGVSVWVVRTRDVVASDPDDATSMFETQDKPFRHAGYYDLPDEVGHM